MLRIIQSAQAGQAKSYYRATDYYLGDGQELAGRWRGEGARRLGLAGEVKQAEWDALCDNLDPQTGKRLTARQRDGRTVGYDFNFHVPKSVSLLYATTRDDRIFDAFRDSMDATMQDIEAEMQTRVRANGKNQDRTTGNLAWGEFVHFTSRPVGGVPDPHLHGHCFVFNVTHDDIENRWKAGQFRGIKADAPYFEAVFHSRLAHRLADLGLPIERTRKGWELAGVSKELVGKFSRRTRLIEAKAQEMGIDSAEAKDGLGAKTREHKAKQLSLSELQETWRARLSPSEDRALKWLAQQVGGEGSPDEEGAPQRALSFAIEHEFERRSVVPERMLLASALRRSVGKASLDQVKDELNRADLIVGQRQGRRLVTTRSVLAEEKRLIDFARNGRGTCRPFVTKPLTFQRDWLTDAQKNAVRHIVQSRDRVVLVRGAAGVGKTTLMQEAVETIEKSGVTVFAFAPSADASRGTLRDAGFKDADTVAMLLKDERLQQRVKGQLLWIDEAGLMGTKTTREVFDLAEKLHCRVLLTGDRYQHGSVERGAALRLLEEEAGLKLASVKEIQRQSGAYRGAIKALSDGQVGEGFKRLDELGWIKEIPHHERYRRMAADYVQAVKDRKSALVVSPTHAEGQRITAEIRRLLRERKKLGARSRTFRTLENASLTDAERRDPSNYLPGDVLVFHQNARGFVRGQRVTVGAEPPPIDQAKRYQLFHARSLELSAGDQVRITHNGKTMDGKHRLNNGSIHRVKRFDQDGNVVLENGWTIAKDFGHLAHGYVVTSHASQSKTVDRVFIGQGFESIAASSREQFYVSASRGKERATIYTGNKQELLEAISQSDERLSAMELVQSPPIRAFEQLKEIERFRAAQELTPRGWTHER